MSLDLRLGLRRLKAALPLEAAAEFDLLEFRLLENLEKSQLHGETETIRYERSTIVKELNSYARARLGQSFNDLCAEPPAEALSPDLPSTASNAAPAAARGPRDDAPVPPYEQAAAREAPPHPAPSSAPLSAPRPRQPWTRGALALALAGLILGLGSFIGGALLFVRAVLLPLGTTGDSALTGLWLLGLGLVLLVITLWKARRYKP